MHETRFFFIDFNEKWNKSYFTTFYLSLTLFACGIIFFIIIFVCVQIEFFKTSHLKL